MRQDYDLKNLISAVANHIVKATNKASRRWFTPICCKPILFVKGMRSRDWYFIDHPEKEEISVNTLWIQSYTCNDEQLAAELCWENYLKTLKFWGDNKYWDICNSSFDVIASKRCKTFDILLVDHETKNIYKAYKYAFTSLPADEFIRMKEEKRNDRFTSEVSNADGNKAGK